jgi:predicted transposase/invertase (TIGR01784 family)
MQFTSFRLQSGVEFTDLIEIHTLELPKLPETADNYLWHWLRFLRAQSKEDLDMVAQASPQLQKTVVKLLELSEDEETRMIYEAEVKAARDQRARMRGAFEKGKVEGIAKGIAEGIAKGENKGRVESKFEMAQKLLKKKMPIEDILEITGLSLDEIEMKLPHSVIY